MEKSTRVGKQTQKFTKDFTEDGGRYNITITIRFDDQCSNGYNTFSITGDVRRYSNNRLIEDRCGCIHEDIKKHFPEYAHLIKWHLCSTEGPMHYFAKTLYLCHNQDRYSFSKGRERELDAARRTAIWPEATDRQLTGPGLRTKLEMRLPALIKEFRRDMLKLGFTW